jgi:hypothetical protein
LTKAPESKSPSCAKPSMCCSASWMRWPATHRYSLGQRGTGGLGAAPGDFSLLCPLQSRVFGGEGVRRTPYLFREISALLNGYSRPYSRPWLKVQVRLQPQHSVEGTCNFCPLSRPQAASRDPRGDGAGVGVGGHKNQFRSSTRKCRPRFSLCNKSCTPQSPQYATNRAVYRSSRICATLCPSIPQGRNPCDSTSPTATPVSSSSRAAATLTRAKEAAILFAGQQPGFRGVTHRWHSAVARSEGGTARETTFAVPDSHATMDGRPDAS